MNWSWLKNVNVWLGGIIVTLVALLGLERSAKEEAEGKLETANSDKKDAVLSDQEAAVVKEIKAVEQAPTPINDLNQIAKDLQ